MVRIRLATEEDVPLSYRWRQDEEVAYCSCHVFAIVGTHPRAAFGQPQFDVHGGDQGRWGMEIDWRLPFSRF